MAGAVFKQCSLSSMKKIYLGYFLTDFGQMNLEVFSTVQFKILSD